MKKAPGSPIKMRMRVLVPKSARLEIARLLKLSAAEKTVQGEATREAVGSYLQKHLDELASGHVSIPTTHTEETITEESRLAIDVLRKAGWSDDRIRSWLMLQNARFQIVGLA